MKNNRTASFLISSTITAGSTTIGGSSNVGTSLGYFYVKKIYFSVLAIDSITSAALDITARVNINLINSTNNIVSNIPGINSSNSSFTFVFKSIGCFFDCNFKIVPSDQLRLVHNVYINASIANNASIVIYAMFTGY